MEERLRKVLEALNAIEVRGGRNLNLLLASIQELERICESLEREARDRNVED